MYIRSIYFIVMKKNIPILLFFVLSSCVSTNYLSIDIREPALITFPSEIENITILNNIPDDSDSTIANDTTYTIISSDSTNLLLTDLLTEYIKGEDYFGNVSGYDKNQPKNGANLSEKEIINICKETQSDALISINSANFTGKQTFFTDDPGFQTIEIGSEVMLMIYKANGEFMRPTINFADTFYWEGYALDQINYRTLPTPDEAMVETVKLTADVLTQQLVPHWQTQNRWYYSDHSSQMKQAAKFVKENKWENAREIWSQLFEKEGKITRKIRLASNIALAYECMDNVTKAYEWNKIAIKLLSENNNATLNDEIILYKVLLERRTKQKKKLDEQFVTEGE